VGRLPQAARDTQTEHIADRFLNRANVVGTTQWALPAAYGIARIGG